MSKFWCKKIIRNIKATSAPNGNLKIVSLCWTDCLSFDTNRIKKCLVYYEVQIIYRKIPRASGPRLIHQTTWHNKNTIYNNRIDTFCCTTTDKKITKKAIDSFHIKPSFNSTVRRRRPFPHISTNNAPFLILKPYNSYLFIRTTRSHVPS